MWYKVKATAEWLVQAESEEEAEEMTEHLEPDTVQVQSVEANRHGND